MAKKKAEDRKAANEGNGSCRYANVEELNKAIAEYFNSCDTTGNIASEHGLALYLKVSRQTLHNWYDGKTCPTFQESVQRAYDEIVDRAYQLLFIGNKNMTPFVIFMLKQVRFGGYQDRIESSGEVQVNVKMGSGMEQSDFA